MKHCMLMNVDKELVFSRFKLASFMQSVKHSSSDLEHQQSPHV